MGKFFDYATTQSSLFSAWRRIRANGLKSRARETREAIEQFDRNADRSIKQIQRRLHKEEFIFDPQKGVLKRKSSGGFRGIVMASVHNRIVERSWLDCLQKKSGFVQNVINQPTSVGGVPDRSVPHGLFQINKAFEEHKHYFVRSDISGFFDNVPRRRVIERIARDVDDPKFLKILDQATTVTLGNEASLGEDRSVFPVEDDGIAQGSPLSPLFGNILLYDFDTKFNQDNLTCIRFIDDFLLLGDSKVRALDAFQDAKKELQKLHLHCHDPFHGTKNLDKASHGTIESGFVFLGYDIRPGLFQPSLKARKNVLKQIDDHISFGRRAILDVEAAKNSLDKRQRYVQTLDLIDRVLRGWGEAFAYGNAVSTIADLDQKIEERLRAFRQWYSRHIQNQDWKTRRRTGGVCLLEDIKPKTFNDVPFRLSAGGRFVRSKRTVDISTDGSVIARGKRRGREQGPGGWAYVVHESGIEGVGHEENTTNNRMELRAVIEAIKIVDPGKSIRIRTDSQYVSDTVNKGNIVRYNQDLWKEFQELAAARRIKIVWVKGHVGDPHNERADQLAEGQARLAEARRS